MSNPREFHVRAVSDAVLFDMDHISNGPFPDSIHVIEKLPYEKLWRLKWESALDSRDSLLKENETLKGFLKRALAFSFPIKHQIESCTDGLKLRVEIIEALNENTAETLRG